MKIFRRKTLNFEGENKEELKTLEHPARLPMPHVHSSMTIAYRSQEGLQWIRYAREVERSRILENDRKATNPDQANGTSKK